METIIGEHIVLCSVLIAKFLHPHTATLIHRSFD